MKTLTEDNFNWLQVEISAVCQAGCIDCNRWRPQGGFDNWQPGQPTEWQLNSTYPHLNKYYQTNDWLTHLEKFSSIKHLQLIGNMGDPMTHPYIIEVCAIIKKTFPNCKIDMSTNGGIGSVDNFEKLAEMNVEITFAIDGLQDTNHIYRRGVEWKKVEQRFKTFINAGGRAQWQWVDFPHTRHQIETARQLSQQWGFDVFDVKSRFTHDPKFDQSIIDASKQPVNLKSRHREESLSKSQLEQDYQSALDEFQNYFVEPKCVDVPNTDYHHPCPHLNVDGTLWPCCYTANIPFHASPHVRNWWQSVTKHFPIGWNSLFNHTPIEILNSEWWQTVLPSSWQSNTNLVCLHHCGKCKD